MVFAAVGLFTVAIIIIVALLFYNNILGTVPPANGALEAYPGATRLDITNQKASNFVYEVDHLLPVWPNSIPVPSVTGDNTGQVTSFYNRSMSSQGYSLSSSQDNIGTVLGPMVVLNFVKGKDLERVEVVRINSDYADVNLKKDQSLIILVKNQPNK